MGLDNSKSVKLYILTILPIVITFIVLTSVIPKICTASSVVEYEYLKNVNKGLIYSAFKSKHFSTIIYIDHISRCVIVFRAAFHSTYSIDRIDIDLLNKLDNDVSNIHIIPIVYSYFKNIFSIHYNQTSIHIIVRRSITGGTYVFKFILYDESCRLPHRALALRFRISASGERKHVVGICIFKLGLSKVVLSSEKQV